MATATVEITLTGYTGLTLSLDLYPLGSDTAAVSGLSLTEATNRKGTYTTTTTAGLSGTYLAIAKEGSTVRGEGYVPMTDTANVHIVGIDLPGKVLGGGSGTISGVGAMVVDGDGEAVAKASAVAALGSGTGARSVTITINDGATALQGVIVRVSQGAESYVQTTNASGVAPFSLDDATWTVTATKAGYSMTSQSLVVNGTESVTYSMTAVSASTPSAPNRSVGTLLCLDTDGTAESGVDVHFRLISGPGTAGYSLDASQWTVTSDASGEIEAEFIIGATYGAKRGDVGREVTFTVASGASFSLPEHLGSP